MGALDELRLAVSTAHVEAAHHIAGRAGDAGLGEGGIDPGRRHDFRVEGAAEEAAFVHMWGGREKQGAVNAQNRLDVHEALFEPDCAPANLDISAGFAPVNRPHSVEQGWSQTLQYYPDPP